MYTRKKPAIDSFPIDLKIEKYFYCNHSDNQIAAQKITGQFQAFLQKECSTKKVLDVRNQLMSDYSLETVESKVRSN